jgi:hypothetical protein
LTAPDAASYSPDADSTLTGQLQEARHEVSAVPARELYGPDILDRRTVKRQEAQDHRTNATTMYRKVELP